jgi:host factor-I protein
MGKSRAGRPEQRRTAFPFLRTGSRRRSVRRSHTPPQGKSTRAPEQTFEEAKYLKQLIEQSKTVRVKLTDDEEVVGVIEYYDQSFIRITRAGEPNLFIFKHDIKYLVEES